MVSQEREGLPHVVFRATDHAHQTMKNASMFTLTARHITVSIQQNYDLDIALQSLLQ